MKFFVWFAARFLFGCLLLIGVARPSIRFGGKKSAVIAGDSGILHIKSDKLTVIEGIINKKEQGTLSGEPITFRNAYLNTGLSESFINGVYKPGLVGETIAGITQFGQIELAQDAQNFETSDFFMTNPGGVLHRVLIKPGKSLIRGQPLFFGKDDITLEGPTSELALGIQNTLNTNITLNGGILSLDNDLSLGDDATLVGDGTVIFNNRRLSLGGTASIWTGNLIWNNALDLQLNSRVELHGSWAFYADSQMNGNGNVLDIANGGSILLYPNSRLRLSGVRLKGLGTGKIIMAPGAELLLSDVEIEMDDNYDIFSGGIYIDGSTHIISKDFILNFRSSTAEDFVLSTGAENQLMFVQGLDTHGSLTIDRVALTYDPLEFLDKYNVRPLRIQDPNHKYINIINHGSIRKFRMESVSFLDYSSDAAMQRYAVVFPVRPVKIFPENIGGALNYEVRVQGRSNYYRFTRAHEPIMFISDGVHAVYEDLLFSEFSPEYLSLGKDASLVFGDKTTVELFRNEELNYRFTFQGNAVLRGNGSIVTLGPTGEIVLQGENSTLLIDGITFKDVSGEKIRCLSDSSKFIFKDVTWIQNDTFDFKTGAFDVLGDFTIIGPHTFNYSSIMPSTILSDATLFLKRGAIFHYEPTQPLLGSIIVAPLPGTIRAEIDIFDQRKLLRMADASATLFMEDATLSAPAPGLQLTTGRLELSKFNYLRNDGGTDAGSGIVFGDGTFADNLFIDQPSSDALRLLSGVLTIQNVAG